MDVSNSGPLILGIDLGTTSAKICLITADSKEAVYMKSRKTLADTLPKPSVHLTDENPFAANSSGYSEQDVLKIWKTLLILLDELPKDLMIRIQGIGVTGQQHGVVLWDFRSFRGAPLDEEFPASVVISNLITWQDQRCSTQFLRSLPRPKENQVLATGYGCCSLFWLLKNDPATVQLYNSGGTIMDFVVWLLCFGPKPVMSPQNAESWGYFSRSDNAWDVETLRNANFPVDLLPNIQQPDQFFAGTLQYDWKGIRRGIPISAAMGDLQCSFIASLENQDDAIMNVSTSSQLTFIRSHSEISVPASCNVRSYFDRQELITAPSLNGGNLLEHFSRVIVQLIQQCTVGDCTEAEIWKLFAEHANSMDWSTADDPSVTARLFGERYDMDSRASIANVFLGNINMGALIRGILKGVICNLESMLPRDVIHASKIKRFMLTGSLFTTFPQLKDFVAKVYGLPVAEKSGGKDAAYGAAYVTAIKVVPSVSV